MKKIILAIVLLFINYHNFTTNSLFRLLPVLFFLFVIFNEVLLRRNSYSFLNKNFFLFHILAVLIIFGVVISGKPGVSIQLKVFKIVSFILFIFAFFGMLNFRMTVINIERLFVKLVYTPFLVYAVLNLILFFLIPVSNQVGHDGIMLSYFGIQHPRVNFLLANGTNAYGASLGILLTISLVLYTIWEGNKRLFLLGIAVSFLSLLLTDSRGPVLYSFIVIILMKILNTMKRPPKILWLVPVLGFVGPIMLLSLLSLLAQTSFGADLSRSSGDLESGNSRAVIWFFAFSDLLTFKPMNHIFGYGDFGHYTAGVSKMWSYIFDSYSSSGEDVGLYMHPHNTFLSIALDYGYFGLLIFSIIQFRVVKAVFLIWNSYRNLALVLLGNLLYWNLVGIGETMFGFYYKNIIYLFFMINVFAFLGISKHREKLNTLYKKKKCLI